MDEGFTIVEVLVAVTLLTVVLLAVERVDRRFVCRISRERSIRLPRALSPGTSPK